MASTHEWLRQFNKRILNPVMLKFAGGSRSPVALVKHRGRTSGKEYRTPVLLKHHPGGFVIALIYGRNVDWYRNVVAAKGGTIRWHGKDYPVGEPVSLSKEFGDSFPLLLRLILWLNNTEHFIIMSTNQPQNLRRVLRIPPELM